MTGAFYRDALLGDVIPFWLRHGLDREQGGILTVLDRDGSVVDTDKSVWFQGRAAWMFATLFLTVEPRPEWIEAARSCLDFLRRHAYAPDGKMYFTLTRDGRPLRMRRYVYSESFSAIANAAFARATGEARAAGEAVRNFATYLRYSFTPGVMAPKAEPTRPAKGVCALMIAVVTAQELREHLGDVPVAGRTCTEWIDACIAEIERDFLKAEHQALLETVAPDGSVIDHADGRLLNPGHALECAWFILHEAARRQRADYLRLGTTIVDWMWARGWDAEHGGLLYFTDLRGLPVQEYWHDMKFWWPHCEAILATLLASKLTGAPRYAEWHRLVHDWSFRHFADPAHGEWFGYLHRDGTVSSRAKGTLWKGPFHLPRMLWYAWRLLDGPPLEFGRVPGVERIGPAEVGGPWNISPLTPALSPFKGEGDATHDGRESPAPSPPAHSQTTPSRTVAPNSQSASHASPSPLHGERAGVRGEADRSTPQHAQTPGAPQPPQSRS